MTGIPSGSTQKFNVTLANFSTSTESIAAGTQLIINVPTGFTVNTGSIAVDAPPLSSTVTTTLFPDGSTQLIATVDTGQTIGASGAQAATVRFTATAPVVSAKALCTMFILANGATSNTPGFPVGPVVEVPLQVLP